MAIHRYERHTNKKSRNYWTQDEFNKFLDTVNDRLDLRLAFVVSYWTGIRIGELLALTYQDINLEDKTISVNKSYQRLNGKGVLTSPKTSNSVRMITMPDFLVEEFREYYGQLNETMESKRVFKLEKSDLEHYMAYAIEKSGVNRISIYELRHSHKNMLVSIGADPQEIARHLGYSSPIPFVITESKLAGLLDKKHGEV